MNTTTTKELPPIAETDSHQGRMIRANRARQARRERIPAVVAERNELAVKCAQWAQMFDDECKTLSQVTAQRDELLVTIKGAFAALSQPVTFTRERSDREHVRAYKILNADCETARNWLKSAISKAEQH